MGIVEISDRERIAALLSDDPLTNLECVDEAKLGTDGLVSVFATEAERPSNLLAVRWGQRPLGFGSLAHLSARSLTGLGELLSDFPRDRGLIELSFPFWASFAVKEAFGGGSAGAEAIYRLDGDGLRLGKSAGQCEVLDSTEELRPMFPKIAEDGPAVALSLRGELASVAVTTHLCGSIARIACYTVEELRGRGFGQGVLSTLAKTLLDREIVPSLRVDLSKEPIVRMVEQVGFRVHAAFLKAEIGAPRASELVIGDWTRRS